MSIIFDLLTSPFGLPINPLLEYLLLAVLGTMAFHIGWEASPGGVFGSLIHWAVRFVVWVLMWAVLYAVIALGKCLFC